MKSNNDTPLITVIIAVFNAETTVRQCLNSFTEQTYQKKQLIIIDGGSKDSTVEIIKDYHDVIDYWISEPDSGIYNAWNKGLKHARGKWIYFLGADDFLWNKDVLTTVSNSLIHVPDSIRVVYGQVNYISTSDRFLYTQGQPWSLIGKKYKQLMTIPHQGVMQRRELFKVHGGFDESFKIAGDYEFLLRELKDHPAVFIQTIVAAMRQGGVSNDNSNSIRIIRELRKAQIKNDIFIPGPFWLLALIRVYLRIFIWRLLGEKLARKLLDIGRSIIGKPAHWTKNL